MRKPARAGGRWSGDEPLLSAVARSRGLVWIILHASPGLAPWALCWHPLRGL